MPEDDGAALWCGGTEVLGVAVRGAGNGILVDGLGLDLGVSGWAGWRGDAGVDEARLAGIGKACSEMRGSQRLERVRTTAKRGPMDKPFKRVLTLFLIHPIHPPWKAQLPTPASLLLYIALLQTDNWKIANCTRPKTRHFRSIKQISAEIFVKIPSLLANSQNLTSI